MNLNRKLILASNSPRRKELLGKLDVEFEVKVKEVPEDYPPTLTAANSCRIFSQPQSRSLPGRFTETK